MTEHQQQLNKLEGTSQAFKPKLNETLKLKKIRTILVRTKTFSKLMKALRI